MRVLSFMNWTSDHAVSRISDPREVLFLVDIRSTMLEQVKCVRGFRCPMFLRNGRVWACQVRACDMSQVTDHYSTVLHTLAAFAEFGGQCVSPAREWGRRGLNHMLLARVRPPPQARPRTCATQLNVRGRQRSDVQPFETLMSFMTVMLCLCLVLSKTGCSLVMCSPREAREASPSGTADASASSTLEHCDACGANSKDADFALPKSLPAAERRQCCECWTVWAPAANILTWKQFKDLMQTSTEFANRVTVAKSQPQGRSAKLHSEHGLGVSFTNGIQIKLARRGRLLTRGDLKFDGVKYTPKQLKLRNEVAFEHEGFSAKGYVCGLGSDCDLEVACVMNVATDTVVLQPGQCDMSELVESAVSQAMKQGTLDGSAKPFLELLTGKAPTLRDIQLRAERCEKSKKGRRVAPRAADGGGASDNSSSSGGALR